MPDLNIEEKIQEALKRKSFKDYKAEYLGLSLIYCIMLFITFAVCYFIPFISIFVFLFVDIPLIMGFKHFIWFGPASGETLIDGFKISMICGYLNFVSYLKIFISSNIKALLISIISFSLAISLGAFIIENSMPETINSLTNALMNSSSEEVLKMMLEKKPKDATVLSASKLHSSWRSYSIRYGYLFNYQNKRRRISR